MSSARLCGLSTRISRQLYDVLSDRAKAQGLTLSSLCAGILETSLPEPLKPRAVVPADLQEIMSQIENLEKLAQLQFSILVAGKDWTIGENVECPGCRSTEIIYYEEADDSGSTAAGEAPILIQGVTCMKCEWFVDLPGAGAGRPCD